MKQRILSAAVGLVVLVVVLSLFNTLVFNAAISIIGVMAVYEFCHATKISENKGLSAAAYLVTAVVPFIPRANEVDWLPVVILPYIGVLFCILLASHKTTRVEQLGLTFMISLAIPLSLTSAVYFRDTYGVTIGLFYLILALGGAWFSDTGAYFVGCAIGKHKMAPIISPKKTWEGAVGGILICGICMLLVAKLFQLAVPQFQVNFLLLILMAPLVSVASIIGDLSASLVKRQFGIKDFGNIMPGHGGVLDRFDSVLFTLPLIWGIVQNHPIVTIGL
ncbi:MAG: CDP-archaeol synthase [Oscillospiraceae bacterium]|nr:CDP-archaeol synthase [Oscillospiraceae bacterium]